MTEIFSDSTRGTRPKNQDELSARLKSIASCINNDENLREVNVEFCKRAFYNWLAAQIDNVQPK